jgi:hypothetical protein
LNTRKYVLILLFSGSIIVAACRRVEEMVVSTGGITTISENTEDASGRLVNIGEDAIQFGHCYSTIPGPAVEDLKTTLGAPIGATFYTSHLANLEAGTKYYIKAYISNGTKTVYGYETGFTTVAASLPVLSTVPVTSITSSTAICG